MMSASFTYGDSKLQYIVFYRSGRRDKIAIHVHPDASVQVDAPKGEELRSIHAAVLKRARWIHRHVSEARQQLEHALPRRYVSGEGHFYLGRRYQLKVLTGTGASVRLAKGRICVESVKRDPDTIKGLLTRWYRERASEVVARRLDLVLQNVEWLKEPPIIRLLAMRKQWGSCSPKGVVFLNPHLVKASRDCIDYVIAHELCHLREHNHSPRYYRLLQKIMPEWRPVKARLDGMAALLLNE